MKNFTGVRVLRPESAIRVEVTPVKPRRDLTMLKAFGIFLVACAAIIFVGVMCAAFGLRPVAPLLGVLIGWFATSYWLSIR